MHVVMARNGQLPKMDDSKLPREYPVGRLVEPQQVLFPSADKLFELHGQLFLPRAKVSEAKSVVKHPAILFFHGGPKRQMLLGYPAMDYYSNAYAFNSTWRRAGTSC